MAAIKSQIHFIGHDFGMPQIPLLQYSPNFMLDDECNESQNSCYVTKSSFYRTWYKKFMLQNMVAINRKTKVHVTQNDCNKGQSLCHKTWL